MAWICDRCKQPESPKVTIVPEGKPCVMITITLSNEKKLTDEWEVCLSCFRYFNEVWNNTTSPASSG